MSRVGLWFCLGHPREANLIVTCDDYVGFCFRFSWTGYCLLRLGFGFGEGRGRSSDARLETSSEFKTTPEYLSGT